jgi:hypothetical protein
VSARNDDGRIIGDGTQWRAVIDTTRFAGGTAP